MNFERGSRKYILTPCRKRLGKAVARRSKSTVAAEVLKDPITKKYVLQRLGVNLRRELALMCSDKVESILQSQDLKCFTWDKLLLEVSEHSPILYSILQSCTHTRRPRHNRNGIIGMCCAILLKFRYGKMSLVQRMVSLILYAGSSGKQV